MITKDEKFKIIKIMGGLGNQMFQYAFGKVLEWEFDYKIYYSLEWFKEILKTKIAGTNKNAENTTIRFLDLGIFGINPETPPQGLLNKNVKTMREPREFRYDKRLLKSKRNFFEGYFQHYKYYEKSADKIRQLFIFPEINKEEENNFYWAEKIKSIRNSVFVHVRRGDYLNPDGSNSFMTLDVNYYQKAIEIISKKVENPVFFIFGQDCEDFIKNDLKIEHPHYCVEDVNTKNGTDWRDMHLMSLCQHSIIANSSFSWWAAFLTDNKSKIVVAPKEWIGKGGGYCVPSLDKG